MIVLFVLGLMLNATAVSGAGPDSDSGHAATMFYVACRLTESGAGTWISSLGAATDSGTFRLYANDAVEAQLFVPGRHLEDAFEAVFADLNGQTFFRVAGSGGRLHNIRLSEVDRSVCDPLDPAVTIREGTAGAYLNLSVDSDTVEDLRVRACLDLDLDGALDETECRDESFQGFGPHVLRLELASLPINVPLRVHVFRQAVLEAMGESTWDLAKGDPSIVPSFDLDGDGRRQVFGMNVETQTIVRGNETVFTRADVLRSAGTTRSDEHQGIPTSVCARVGKPCTSSSANAPADRGPPAAASIRLSEKDGTAVVTVTGIDPSRCPCLARIQTSEGSVVTPLAPAGDALKGATAIGRAEVTRVVAMDSGNTVVAERTVAPVARPSSSLRFAVIGVAAIVLPALGLAAFRMRPRKRGSLRSISGPAIPIAPATTSGTSVGNFEVPAAGGVAVFETRPAGLFRPGIRLKLLHSPSQVHVGGLPLDEGAEVELHSRTVIEAGDSMIEYAPTGTFSGGSPGTTGGSA
ncbi:MAG: hypothetical protein ACT4PT_08170 [Methanobacteriota archaeon]